VPLRPPKTAQGDVLSRVVQVLPKNSYAGRPHPAAPAIEASGVRKPARVYDLRSTFASNALKAGVSVFRSPA
jgi:hypothetical protein